MKPSDSTAAYKKSKIKISFKMTRIKPLHYVRQKLATSVIALCGALMTTSGFGQTTYVWTGGGDGTNLATAANWGGTYPATGSSDTGEWNGTVPGNLVLHYNNPNANFQSGPGSSGVNFHLAGAQTGSIQIVNDVASPPYLAITDIRIDSGAGSFILGETNTAHRLDVIGRPSGAVHVYLNDSANPAIINPFVRWAGGGGAAYTLDFQGAGNWYCTNYLVNDNGPGMTVQVDGPGAMYWSPSVPTTYQANGIVSPVVINAGKLVLQAPHPKLTSQAFTLGGTFEYNAPAKSQTLTGVFSGAGTNIVRGGTLTLSAQSTYTGDTVLYGGELIVNGAENPGTSGPLGLGLISFSGGTLGYSLNNTFDYTARFSTAAGQAYSIDTAGQNVTFTNAAGLSSSGGSLTKLGSGMLTLAEASTYTGNTTVSGGKLLFQGIKSGSGNITIGNSTTLGVTENGAQITPTLLTVGTSASATLEFNSVVSTTTAPMAAGAIAAGGPITVNVASGVFAIGQTFPLFSWTSGSAPAVTLGTLTGAGGNLTTNGNMIQLNITSLAFVWTGLTDANWDTATIGDWKVNGVSQVFANGGTALFDDTVASANTNITLNSPVLPASVTVNSSTKTYSITSSGANIIGGTGSLTKNGNSTLTLAGGINTYSGATTISGGTLSVGALANGGSPSDIGAAGNGAANLVLNGGTLQYTGAGASSDHLFTLGTAGGTIDDAGSGALIFNNTGVIALNGTGARTLTLAGSDTSGDTFAPVLGENGGATALTKNGAGTWILTGNNTYSGLTTINNGVLQIGAGGTTGSLGSGNVLNNRGLDFNRTDAFTFGGNISGTGSVTNDGTGALILTGNNNYSGGTVVNAGTLQLGTGGTGATLNPNASIIINTNCTFILNSKTPLSLSGFNVGIQGAGNLVVRSGCSLISIDANDYTGWTLIESDATFQPCTGNEGHLYSSLITNNGTLMLVRQDADPAVFGISNNIVGTGRVVKENNNANTGWVTLAGTNTYSGDTWIAGGGIVLGDGINPTAGSIVGNVWFTNTTTAYHNTRLLIFQRADDFTFTNQVKSVVTDGSATADQGALRQMGPGAVTLAGNISYPGTTTIDANTTLLLGAGGTSGTIGSGGIVNDGTFVYNRSDDMVLSNVISSSAAAGSVVKLGAGTLTLTATNTYTGATTISNGTLVVASSSVAGDVYVEGGTLVPAALGAVGNMSLVNMYIDSGTVQITVNKSLQTNSVIMPGGGLTVTGGSVKVVNAGTDLVAGDTFTIFNQPVTGGATMTVTGVGATWKNNLAVDGTISALTVTPSINPNPPTMQVNMSGNTLSLGWPTNLGWILQTNSTGLAAANQWFSYPGSSTLTNVNITVNPAVANVYFRMVHTNTP